jgi:hypothetical protein
MKCPHCNQEHLVGPRFCPETGKEIPKQQDALAAGFPQTPILTPVLSETETGTPKSNWLMIAGGIVVLLIVAVILFNVFQKGTPQVAALSTATSAPTQASPTLTSAAIQVSTGPAACQAFDLIPTADPTVTAMFPPITAEDWSTGLDTAAVTFLEYSDFQ